jgi:hypothetical protein
MHLLAIIPFVAIWLCFRYPLLYVFDGDISSSSNQTELISVLISPGCLLALRALFDVNLVTLSDLIFPSVLGVFIFTLLWFFIIPSARKNVVSFISFIIVILPYPVGFIMIFNTLYDVSEPTYYTPTVFYKESSSGKYPSYDVYTEPVTLKEGHMMTEFSLSRQKYERIDAGERICIIIRSGAFGISWYDVVSPNSCVIQSKTNPE